MGMTVRYFPEDYSKTAKQFAEEFIRNIDDDIYGTISVSAENPPRWTSTAYSKGYGHPHRYDNPFDSAWEAIPYKVAHYTLGTCIKTEIYAIRRGGPPKKCKRGSDRIKELRHLFNKLDSVENKMRDVSTQLEALKKNYNADIRIFIGGSRLSTLVSSERDCIKEALEREV